MKSEHQFQRVAFAGGAEPLVQAGLHQSQVSIRADRQEFGDSLHEAQQNCPGCLQVKHSAFHKY